MAARTPTAGPLPEAPTITIDGVGTVPVPPNFRSLPLDQQNALVDQIVAQQRGPAQPPPPNSLPPGSGPVTAQSAATLLPAGKVDEETRGTLLPIATTEEGQFTLAVPEFLHTPLNAMFDVISGRRTTSQFTPAEVFGMGGLSAGLTRSVATGTTRGIAQADAAARRPAAAAVEGAAAEAGATAAATATAPVAAAVTRRTTTDELRAASQSFYREAEEAGVVVNTRSDAFRSTVSDMASTAKKSGLDETLTPDSMAAMRRIATDLQAAGRTGEGLSFQQLEILRRIASNAEGKAIGAKNNADARIAGMIKDKIDDFIAKMGADDVLSGNPEIASRTITQARDLWSKVAKLETVERLVTRAEVSAAGFSGAGFEIALRTEFRALAKNDRMMRTFTAQEQEAIRKIAQGTATANTARNIGKLAPTGVVSLGMSGGIGGAIGSAVGMPFAGAMATMGVGYMSRQLATVLTRRAVNQLEDVIKVGGSELASGAIARGNTLIESLVPAATSAAATP